MDKIITFIKKEWLALLLIIISFGVGLYVAPMLPDQIPTHWNIRGEVDAYGPRIMGVVGFPLITLGVYLLMILSPFIDPKRKNYDLFKGTYKNIRLFFVLFFVLLHIVTILVSLGHDIKVDKLIVFMVGILFISLGNYFGKVRQNWFIGIKTPWTLSDPEVWNITHRTSGKLWVITGFAIIITSFINPVITFAFVMIAAFFPILYSYIIFKRKQK